MQVLGINSIPEHDMVSSSPDSIGSVLPLGYTRPFRIGRAGGHDCPHPCERVHREQSQDTTDQADEVQG